MTTQKRGKVKIKKDLMYLSLDGITHDDIYKRALAAQAIEAFDAGEE
jgi:hypothetical protein